jgi:prevent-host-death family protein
MQKTISATQARIHFGELLRTAQEAPVVVERDGQPQVVVLSLQAYEQLAASAAVRRQSDLLQEVHRRVRVDLAGRTLPPAEEIIQQLRMERDEPFQDLR